MIPKADLWGVEFPALEGSQEFVARMLVECSFCRSREVVYLNEFELGGFEQNRGIARHCKVCDVPTIWRQAPHEVAKVDPVKFAASVHSASDMERRQSLRLQTRLTACVRVAGSDDELAVCEEISAEGLCFRSKRRYDENCRIDIAVPYADATANIFVPARVVRVEPTPTAGLFRHGVEFLRVAAQAGVGRRSDCNSKLRPYVAQPLLAVSVLDFLLRQTIGAGTRQECLCYFRKPRRCGARLSGGACSGARC